MNAAQVIDHFDRICDAPDAIPRLRRFILDLAVRGKLVEQDPTDEPAAELLKRIQETKAGLLKEGRIKKSTLLESIRASAVLFEIPSSWEWVRLGQVSNLITKGSTPTSYGHSYVLSGINFIKVEAIRDSKLIPENVTSYITKETHEFLKRSQLASGDFLFSIAGSIGTCAIVTEALLPANTNQALAIIRGADAAFLIPFLQYSTRSSLLESALAKARGGAMNNISLEDVSNLLLALPPLAEQHRIVVKVDELMALCDRLEAAQTERESRRGKLAAASLHRLNNGADAEEFREHARFHLRHLPRLTTRPEHIQQLRQTILTLAVQGKLVPQDPRDEPASELLKRIQAEKVQMISDSKATKHLQLPAIDKNEAPFDLPAGWTWARFPELGIFGRGKSKHRPRNDAALFERGTHLFVQTGDVARSNGIIQTYTSKYNEIGLAQSSKWPKGTLCITIAANIADSGILSFDGCFPDSIVGFIPASVFPSGRYFEYFIRTAKADLLEFAPATAQKNINLGILNAVLIPLPPLAEHYRIVRKVDELMTICNHLEENLTVSRTIVTAFMGTVLAELLQQQDFVGHRRTQPSWAPENSEVTT